MIDRKTLWISGLILLAMTAAAVWRLSLLQDWHHLPIRGPFGTHTVNGLILLVSPLCLLFVLAVLYARKWFLTGPEEAVGPWRRWSATMLVAYGAIVALMQAIVIARSFGVDVPLRPLAVARAVFVLIGGLILVLGNALPKLPWLSARVRFLQLDPWQGTRHLRFMGKINVALGLAIVACGLILPPRIWLPTILCLWLAGMTASLWYRAKLRNDQPQP